MGSRINMLGCFMSIFARSTCAPALNLPARICLKSSMFSSSVLSLKGLLVPVCVGVPFCSAINVLD